ncbi:MAG TPA: YkgJ family cysteine cluster protein [Geobacteraceae bacterium]|nr:YkgJ family cysteine cluster protein [Geobacteraceae bacterium]
MVHCADEIRCQKGCDSCCRHFSVFWVEAVNLALAAKQLPEQKLSTLRNRAQSFENDAAVCPLLEDGACLLYDARPIICRTHGLPILSRNNETHVIDFCPCNFTTMESIPGNLVINLDLLNNTLAAINALFVSRFFDGNPPPTERLAIAEALLITL